MKTRNLSLKELKSLVKKIISEQSNDRYILIPYNDDAEETFDEYGIDYYDAQKTAYDIAKNGGVTILRNKELSGVLIDAKLSLVIGAIWTSIDDNIFSFDIAIDPSYQNMGLSHMLIKDGINQYKNEKFAYDDMDEDFEMELDVINPKLADILKNKYGFHVVGQLSPNRVLMHMD
jgi:ribosomal protein S18 acetylase RimI-like enzyme